MWWLAPCLLCLFSTLATYLIQRERQTSSLCCSKHNRTRAPPKKIPKKPKQRSRSRLRFAEKNRTATCSFADRLTQLVFDAYRTQCPAELQASYKQTVVAGFLIENTQLETLTCVAIGVGTKYLSAAAIQSDPQGHRVRDSHAEILARRSLQHYLYTQIEQCQLSVGGLGGTVSIFTEHALFPHVPAGEAPFQLREHMRLHFYSSSVPCGNASIKRWAHPKRPTQYDLLPPTQYPNEPHLPLYIMQPEQGQVALLVKRERGVGSNAEVSAACHPHIIAPGSAPVHTGRGSILTCSDKIAVWNAVGVQGCLLSCLVAPMYIQTCTIGRKFSLKTCQRALCCRVSNFVSDDNIFSVHHPSMLQTSIKFDSSMVRDVSEEGASGGSGGSGGRAPPAVKYSGALFLESRCFWWSSSGVCMEKCHHFGCCKCGNSGIIDGTTGLRADSPQECVLTSVDRVNRVNREEFSSQSTDVSRTQLLARFRSIWFYGTTPMEEMTTERCNPSERDVLLHGSYTETKMLCEKMALTTYRQAKFKLMNTFFKMK